MYCYVMSPSEEIPAFSIWKTFYETIPQLTSTKQAEQFAKIIKSGDFSNIFVYERSSGLGCNEQEKIAGRYKSFTTWFLGKFFYLLSCKKLSRLHNVYVDIQLSVLEQLSHTQLHVYNEMAKEYCKAFNSLVKFIKHKNDSLVLQVFIPKNDLNELTFEPQFVVIGQTDHEEFLVNLLKIISYIVNQNFDVQCYDGLTIQNLDNFVYLISEGNFPMKLQIVQTYLEIAKKVTDFEGLIWGKLELLAQFFEQIVYKVYTSKVAGRVKQFESQLYEFLELNSNNDRFLKISEFLLTAVLDPTPSEKIRKLCYKRREKPLYEPGDFEVYIQKSLGDYNPLAICGLKLFINNEINAFCSNQEGAPVVKLFELGRWKFFYSILAQTVENTDCGNSCKLLPFLEFMIELTNLLLEIRLEKHPLKVIFFEESSFLTKALSVVNKHFSSCEKTVDFKTVYDFLLKLSLCYSSHVVTFFDIFAYTFTSSFIDQYTPRDYGRYKKELNDFCKFSSRFLNDKELASEFLNKFLTGVSSGIYEPTDIHNMENTYRKILEKGAKPQISNLPHLLTVFNNADRLISEILVPALSSDDPNIRRNVTQVLGKIICILSSDFKKGIKIESGEMKVEIYCDKCQISGHFLEIHFSKIDLDVSMGNILKHVLKFLTFDDPELKVAALEVLPNFSNHIFKFHTPQVAKIWVEKCGDSSGSVRKKFGEVAPKIIKHCQENTVLSVSTKSEILEVLLSFLQNLTRTSLQETDVELQETILDTIQHLATIKCTQTVLPIIRILIYFIMVPTSRHQFVAVEIFLKLAQISNCSPNQMYKKYKKEICELVAHLCIVNQNLLDYSLETSLFKISQTLEFYDSKDFITRECQYFLSFFVVKVVRSPVVSKLLEEMALMLKTVLPEILKNVYGHIFLHIFLNEQREDFKLCSKYLETTTGQSSSSLRKRNLWVILIELLLNFHEKKDKVLLALKQLANEDSDGKVGNVPDYLQPKLLGLLQQIDFKLMAKDSSRKGSILLSLADFLKYMGPSYISPVRFKIIAMLQTACVGFPELHCEVWDSFIKTCDVESLAPQLATIFVSVLPLIQTCPRQINDVFKYLVIQNEKQTKDYIKDLFFVDDQKVDYLVVQTIRKYTRQFDDCSLKEKINTFLKYLTHETSEIRIRSLKHLKILMEQNREELDQMILGYNGIDPILVDLLEILTLGCREKDPLLRLACGEVIGELGAVEPSHLPRRYAQDSRNFSFFMTDDSFIVNSLNELTKALQGEKNTVNMDRLALAIQEILKNYRISSDATSFRNYVWKQFSDSQQAVMLPLLTSRYIVSQPQEVSFSSPIYGSDQGDSFERWLYNWTRSLIATLPQENQAILHPCLPAMKQDNRILMLFLPHILLHSVLLDNREMYIEIKTVISSFDSKTKAQDLDSLLPDAASTLVLKPPEIVERTQCTKVVFRILDFLDRWTREWQWTNGSRGRADNNFKKIKIFLDRFCKLELAKCNFHCGEYPRALMYLEDYISEHSHDVAPQLTFLTKIYAQLDEPDGVAGVTSLQPTEPPIEQRILHLEVSGKLSDAAACYERLPSPLKINHLKGLIQCYLDLDNVNTALNFAQGALDHHLEFGNMLLEMQSEPLWRLGRYDDLDVLLKRPEMEENISWGVQIGKTLLAFQNRDRELFEGLVQKLKAQQTDLLGAASVQNGAYQHGYCYISRLHALNELQQVEKATFDILARPTNDFVSKTIKNLSKEWELRIKVVQESVRIIEPVLCLRRVSIEQSKRILEKKVPNAVPQMNSLLGECWLYSAKTARCIGVHQQSYTYTLKAEEYSPPGLFVEKSKLYWLREEHEHALITLRRGLEILLPENSKEAIEALSLEKRKICSEAKLLIATYNDTISNVDTDINTSNYREACEMYKEWETGLVSLAQFYDRRFQNYSDEDRDSKGSDLQILMINYFCKSLRYGTAFVYQSMPRLLSIWFDYGTRLLNVTDPQIRDERKNNLIKMTKLIDYALENLPAYVFFTAFSQIISRICHPQREVYVELKSIIIKLLVHYPQQSLWMIISVMKSSYEFRAKRCVEIFADPKMKTSSMSKLVRDFTGLAEKLIDLCDKTVPADVETTTVSSLLRTLPRMLQKGDFSEIMIPTHKFRKLVLPNPDFANGEHNAFPNHYVHIAGIDEQITIIRSLQRPRKITFRGSDGKGYIQMLKPKDDLRKDFRLMEFNDIVNQLLSRESESRERRLNIRLYSVSPLNEECGLIEWIPNLVGLRPVLTNIYKQKGIGMSLKEVRDASCSIRDPLSKKRDIFTKTLLQKHPPVLGEWFRRTFPDAQSWFFARTAYTRTTAVISMVGYILGLGDRHGENILFDSICGDTVHVDFNCLFNKGETFEWPERVPFRLTQNLVAAMGPLGVEGVFRKSCACTLRVLRTNTNTLMSIVTPFVYDPLVSWSGKSKTISAEKTNEQALDHIKNIKLRLNGVIVKTRDRSLSIPLSVDGQTNSLINEAMSVDNLCQMYIGWGPYL